MNAGHEVCGLGIVIAAESPIPVGLALTNRLMPLVRGYVKNGFRVRAIPVNTLGGVS
jgi:hypothetical protein